MEFSVQLILPLLGKIAWTYYKAAFDVASHYEFLHSIITPIYEKLNVEHQADNRTSMLHPPILVDIQ